MNCNGSPYCGILALERGEGSGNYQHPSPAVHGLWPQVGRYGNSECLHAVKGQSVQSLDIDCYNDRIFEQHEWDAHGVCAAHDPSTYFQIVCGLSKEPLEKMSILRKEGKNLNEISKAMINLGYPVIDARLGNDQLAISVCAGRDLVWKIAAQSEFKSKCAN